MVGILYMMLVGRRLLPDHREESLTEEYAIREYLSEILVSGIEILADLKVGDRDLQNRDIRILEVIVTPQSDLIGQTLKEAKLRARYGMTALAINRQAQSLREKIGRILLRVGEMLLIQGPRGTPAGVQEAGRPVDNRRIPPISVRAWGCEPSSSSCWRYPCR